MHETGKGAKSLLTAAAVVALGSFMLFSACRSDPSLQPETPAATSNSGSYGSELDFLHNPRKVEGFRFDPLPPRGEGGVLPRGLNAFTLGGAAPPDGKTYRGDHEVVFIENNLRSHRLRVFSRAGVVFRLLSHTLLDEADTQDHGALLNRIKLHYGEPARELTDELTWVDRDTVMVISIGGRYLITDIADAETGDFAPHIYDLLDTVYR